MKKYLLIAILFALLNGLLTAQIVVSGKASARTSEEAELAAQNQFRRNLLVYTSQYYQEKLGKYWQIFYDSKQNIHREVLEELTELADRKRGREKGVHTCTITLDKAVFERFFADRLPVSYVGWDNDIIYMLLTVDAALLAPNATLVAKLDRLAAALQELEVDYHGKYLLFQETEQEITIQTPAGLLATLNFTTASSDKIAKTADKAGEVILNVSFGWKPADFNIPHGVYEANISFTLDTEKTFRTNQLKHAQFLAAFIDTFLTDVSGNINIRYVSDSFFYVRSTNLKSGVSVVIDQLRQRGWGVGTAQRFTHQIVISKEVVEQKMLNAGVYYVKAYAVVEVFDSKRVKVQSRRSADVEAIDNVSFEGCWAKVDALLVGLLGGLL